MKVSTQGIQPLPRPVRQIWMVLHVVCSVGWLGVLVASLALCLAALGTDDPARATALYTAVVTLSDTFFLPGTLLVLLTGVVLGVGTKWGLVRFYWVLVKLVIALVLLVAANLVLAGQVRDQASTSDGVGLAGVFTVLALTTALATILSITKPWGRVNRRRPSRVSVTQELS